jgi:hypothetical protein
LSVNNNLEYKDDANDTQDTGLDFVKGQWQEYKIEYDFAGTDSVVLTVDGDSSAALETELENQQLSHVTFRVAVAGDPSDFYIDAVPGPTVPTGHVALVTHSVSGVLFDENFEGQDVDGTPPVTGDITPGGNSEAWTGVLAAGGGVVDVLDTSPFAPQGSKFMRLERPTGGTSEIHADFANVNSGTLTVEFAAYVPTNVAAHAVKFQVRFDRAGGSQEPAFQLRFNTVNLESTEFWVM